MPSLSRYVIPNIDNALSQTQPLNMSQDMFRSGGGSEQDSEIHVAGWMNDEDVKA